MTPLKRQKMAPTQALLSHLAEGLSRLSPDFFPLTPSDEVTKDLYWDDVLTYAVTKDTKAELDQLGAAIEEKLAEVRVYLAAQSFLSCCLEHVRKKQLRLYFYFPDQPEKIS